MLNSHNRSNPFNCDQTTNQYIDPVSVSFMVSQVQSATNIFCLIQPDINC